MDMKMSDASNDPLKARTLTVGVLETGLPPEELAPDHGDYPSMVENWLKPLNAGFRPYAILSGELPENPDEADVWVITGSKFGVYEDHDWIPPLEEFIRACKNQGRLMVGICFGHQLIARALGGVVRKSAKGWGVGPHEYDTSAWPAKLGPVPETLDLQAYHQDQVETLPEGAQTIASSEFCEHAALWYPGFAITVQGHPEFSKPYVTALIECRRGSVLTEEDADQGQKNMARKVNADTLAGLIARHLSDI